MAARWADDAPRPASLPATGPPRPRRRPASRTPFSRPLEAAMQGAIGHRWSASCATMPRPGATAVSTAARSGPPLPSPRSKPVDWSHPMGGCGCCAKAAPGSSATATAGRHPPGPFRSREDRRPRGWESAMNLPVWWNGTALGAVNLRHGPGHFSEAGTRRSAWVFASPRGARAARAVRGGKKGNPDHARRPSPRTGAGAGAAWVLGGRS